MVNLLGDGRLTADKHRVNLPSTLHLDGKLRTKITCCRQFSGSYGSSRASESRKISSAVPSNCRTRTSIDKREIAPVGNLWKCRHSADRRNNREIVNIAVTTIRSPVTRLFGKVATTRRACATCKTRCVPHPVACERSKNGGVPPAPGVFDRNPSPENRRENRPRRPA